MAISVALLLEASDRDISRTVCDSGLRSFLTGWITASEERRAARHAASTKPKTGPRCPQCNSVCFRIRTTEPHVVPRQVRQHLVTVQRHRRTRRTSAAAATTGGHSSRYSRSRLQSRPVAHQLTKFQHNRAMLLMI